MNGLRAVHLQQVHQGLPVYQRYVVVTLDDAGEVRSLSSDAMPLRSVDGDGDLRVRGEGGPRARRSIMGASLRGVMAPMSARQVVVADSASAVTAWHVQVAARTDDDACGCARGWARWAGLVGAR
jgi:Zn-dependent metalloprotease